MSESQLNQKDDILKKMSKEELLDYLRNVSRQDLLSFAIKLNHSSNADGNPSISNVHNKESRNDSVTAAGLLLQMGTRLDPQEPTEINIPKQILIEETRETNNDTENITNNNENTKFDDSFLELNFQNSLSDLEYFNEEIGDGNITTTIVEKMDKIEKIVKGPTKTNEELKDKTTTKNTEITEEQVSNKISTKESTKCQEQSKTTPAIEHRENQRLSKERNKKRCKTKHDELIHDCTQIQERIQR